MASTRSSRLAWPPQRVTSRTSIGRNRRFQDLSHRSNDWGVSRGIDPAARYLFITGGLSFCYNTAHMGKKRLFTGLQPSGTLHIGNYLGALKQTVELLQDAEGLRKNIPDVVRDYVAVGVDPKKAIIFQQSAVSQHTELAWIFDCLVT